MKRGEKEGRGELTGMLAWRLSDPTKFVLTLREKRA